MSPGETATPLAPEYRVSGRRGAWVDWRKSVVLLRHLTRRQLAVRYRGSALGFLWSLLNPILMMAVYTFVFKFVFRMSAPGVPYPVFFLSGLLAWNFMHIATMNSGSAVVDNLALMDKAYFPRVTLPLSAVAANLINYLVALPVLIVFGLCYGIVPGTSMLLLPLAVLHLVALATALGLIAAAWNPFFRDLTQLMELFFFAWFFASPVLYPVSMAQQNLSSGVYALYRLNPVVGVQSLLRAVFLNQRLDPVAVFVSALITMLLLVFGCWLFQRNAPRFDEAI